MGKYRLISFNLCPFVQRSIITLNEKGVDYDIEYIDLAAKPDWFLAISPRGKVPLLQVDDTVLFESAAINEFVDETTGAPLMPTDPLVRAQHRAWIELASVGIGSGFRMQMAPDEATTMTYADTVRGELARFEGQLGNGPLFHGDAFTLVDAATAPHLQRLTWCEKIAPQLALFAGVPNVAAWRDTLLDRNSVKTSTIPDIHAVFLEYVRGRGSPARNTEPSWLGTLTS